MSYHHVTSILRRATSKCRRHNVDRNARLVNVAYARAIDDAAHGDRSAIIMARRKLARYAIGVWRRADMRMEA